VEDEAGCSRSFSHFTFKGAHSLAGPDNMVSHLRARSTLVTHDTAQMTGPGASSSSAPRGDGGGEELSSSLKGAVAAVTGGAGYVGRKLCLALIQAGCSEAGAYTRPLLSST